MKNKIRIWIYPFVIMGTCLLLTSSCKKDEQTPQDIPVKMAMTNGVVIYAYPMDKDGSTQWGDYENDIPGLANMQPKDAYMDFNGEANTAAIVAHLKDNSGTSYAAKRCADLEAFGFNDWYLPAEGELNEIYKKLGPVANGGKGEIITGTYWSSTEFSRYSAWRQNFSNGFQVYDLKNNDGSCLCVRKSGEMERKKIIRK